MAERTMSPTATQAHAKRIMRSRYKALRLGKRVDSPAILAGRLVAYATETAKAYPVDPPSPAYREYIESHFHERFIELCKLAPIAEVRR